MAEFTQEQLDAIVAEKIADATKGLFNEEELNRRVTSEVDRRVETGIQKGLETQKQKWEKELAEKAKLTAEELAKKELEEKTSELTQKEKEVLRKANLIDAKELLAEAEIPKAYYDKFIGMLVSDDAEVTMANINNFIEMYTSTKNEIETKVKSELIKVPKPEDGSGDEAVTKEKFNKMGYAEKVKFKQTNPELYKEFIK